MVEYMAVSGPNCSKSKDLSASDNTRQGNQIASFRDLLMNRKSQLKPRDYAAADTSKVNQVAKFRSLLVKGI